MIKGRQLWLNTLQSVVMKFTVSCFQQKYGYTHPVDKIKSTLDEANWSYVKPQQLNFFVHQHDWNTMFNGREHAN